MINNGSKYIMLKEEFYRYGALKIAPELIGKLLVRKYNGIELVSRITETEAYVGSRDKACHAYNNRRTKRTEVMFKSGGFAYIYMIYGMYFCFNIVAGREGSPEAVLIRAVEPVKDCEMMKKNRGYLKNNLKDLTNGPGKLCIAMNIDMSLNGYDLTNGKKLYIEDDGNCCKIISLPRINIDYAGEYRDKPWRFTMIRNSDH